MMAPHTWRRRHFRFPGTDVVVNGGAVEGELLNVARTGLAIETTFPIQIGREYRLKVTYEEASFGATGRVRWCVLRRMRRNRSGEVVPVYHAGFSLEERERKAQEAVLEKLRKKLLAPPPY
jgi:hypothetical protein